MKDKVTVIGIAGGTGSGKTTVVKKLVEVLPPHYVAVVPLDSYYNDTSQMTEEERHRINFDHPSAFDWKLLHQQLADLRAGKAIEQPTYSYIKCNREPETIHVDPKPVVIIEGIMTLVDKKLRSSRGLPLRSWRRSGRLIPCCTSAWLEANIWRRNSWIDTSYIY